MENSDIKAQATQLEEFKNQIEIKTSKLKTELAAMTELQKATHCDFETACGQIDEARKELATAKAALEAAIEQCAITAWNTLMAVARERRMSPTFLNDEFGVCKAIRGLKTPLPKGQSNENR